MALQLCLQNRVFLSSHRRTISFKGNVPRDKLPDPIFRSHDMKQGTVADNFQISEEVARNKPLPGRAIMLRFRWLAVVGVSVLLAGCSEMLPPCPQPGGMPQRGGIGATETCYYLLTIYQKDPAVIAHVARSAVQNNIDQRPWYDLRRFKIIDYPFHLYPIELSNPTDKDKLDVGKDYWFVKKPDSPKLELTADNDLPEHKNELPKSALADSAMPKAKP